LNVSDDLCIWCEFMSVYVYEKSLMVLTICVYDSSVDNVWEQLKVLDHIIYTNLQEHSTLIWRYQQNYHIHNSSRTFNSSQKISTELSYKQIVRNIQLLSDTLDITSWRFLTICVYDSSVDNFREKLNFFDDLCIR
jgi:hypothetical protein